MSAAATNLGSSIARDLGEALREARSTKNRLPSYVTKHTQILPVDLAAIERGSRLPTGEELRRLLSVTGIPPRDFVASLQNPELQTCASNLLLQKATVPATSTDKVTTVSQSEDTSTSTSPSPPVVPEARREAKATSKDSKTGGPTTPVTLSGIRANLGDMFKPSMVTVESAKPAQEDTGKDEEVHRVGEVVYRFSYANVQLEVCVYTSINSDSKEAYPVGTDAIRVLVFDRRSNRKVEAWSSRINRIGNWPTRLRRLAGEAVLRASYRPSCRKCPTQPEMAIRGSSGDQFWGCPNYFGQARCNYTHRARLPRVKFLPQDKTDTSMRTGVREHSHRRNASTQAAANHMSRAALNR